MKNKKEKLKISNNILYNLALWCILLNVTHLFILLVLLGVRNKQIADDYVPSTDPIAMFV